MLIRLLLKKEEKIKKEKIRKERRRNAHCDTVKVTIFLLSLHTTVFYTVVQRFVCAVVFLFSIFAALLFIFVATINIRS